MKPATTRSIIRDEAELAALIPFWRRLANDEPPATPFQSSEWLLGWWRHLGRGRLLSVAVWEDGSLHTLIPGFVQRRAGFGMRRWHLLGTGQSDILRPLGDPSALPAILAATASEWDILDWQQVPADDPVLSTLREERPTISEQSIRPVLDLRGGTYGTPKLRSNLRQARKRLERSHYVAIEEADTATVHAALDDLFRLHGLRWRSRWQPGVFCLPAIRAFHRHSASGLAATGSLRLYRLLVDEKVVAAIHCFGTPRKVCYYGGGFDPVWARFSPSSLLVQHAIEAAIRDGAAEFDFLRGTEPYKYRWGAVNQVNYRVQLRSRLLPRY